MRRRRAPYAEALREIRGWAAEAAAPGFSDEEWRDVLRRATRQPRESARPARIPIWRPALAGAAVLAALIGGALYLAQGPFSAGLRIPDGRAGEMLPADPRALLAPEAARPLAVADDGRNPFLANPPLLAPAWIAVKPGAGPTVFLFVPLPARRLSP